MKNVSILKLNNFDSFFWKTKLGFNQEFELLDYSEFILMEKAKIADVIVLDFYFSRLSLKQEQEIILQAMASLIHSEREIHLFILSPSFAGDPILRIKKRNLSINCHNFSSTILERICTQLNANINLQKAS
ncbi:MAG: hypothetical protein ACI857_000466 [Arenicella sp.]|jgi:hypothetical protein